MLEICFSEIFSSDHEKLRVTYKNNNNDYSDRNNDNNNDNNYINNINHDNNKDDYVHIIMFLLTLFIYLTA